MLRGHVGPAPVGALRLTVECRTRSREATGGEVVVRHPVEIGADWSVVVPHDLTAARREVALGGEVSCVRLVDDVVPALRDLLQLRARRVLPPLTRNGAGRWVVREPTAGCRCATDSFPGAAAAATHVRGEDHLARRYAVAVRDLAPLAEVAERAHGGFSQCPPWGWAALGSVRGHRGLDELWAAGVPPELVVEAQARLLPRGESLTVAAHLAVAFGGADLDWLAAVVRDATTVEVRGDRGVAALVEWAAWAHGPADRRRPGLRAAWLRLGLPWSAVDSLVAGEVTVEEAEALGEATGRARDEAGRLLAQWQRAGCRPGVGDIAMVDRGGARDFVPTAEDVDGVLARVRHPSARPTRTQAAVLLGLSGSRARAAALAEQGHVDGLRALEALRSGIGIPAEPRA